MPPPIWVSAPVPLMTLATVRALLRLMIKAALSVIAPVPAMPVVAAVPTCRVPALIVVPPV